LVNDYTPVKSKRAFPLYLFWKDVLYVSLLFWLHDLQVF
jgi:hypothetical protein